MTSSAVQVLDIPPYNTFTGSCSVSVEVPGLEGRVQQQRGTWLWERKKGSKDFCLVNKVNVMDNSTVSKVVMNEVSEGQVLYRCTYNLEGRDNINSIDKMAISVIGKYL